MLVLLATVVIGVAMLAMGVGAIFSKRCLRGSCGGPEVFDTQGTTITCDTCPRNPRRARP